MANAADLAGELIEERDAAREQVIAARRQQFEIESETHCVECDDEIPERRRALGGVTRCVDCQGIFEARGR
jgi:phage/conjugal plasmid C-4 type zinc finger TraR family protein